MNKFTVKDLAAFAFGMFFIICVFFQNAPRPNLLKSAVGCYNQSGGTGNIKIEITPSGRLVSKNINVEISMTEDKIGISLFGKNRIFLDKGIGLVKEDVNKSPYLLRFEEDGNILKIPDSMLNYISFLKTKC